jgi:hypothetical protein
MSHDRGRAADAMGVGVSAWMGEGGFGTTTWRVDRWDAEQTAWAQRKLLHDLPVSSGVPWKTLQPTGADFRRLGVAPYLSTETVGNAVLQAGWARVLANLTAVPAATAVYDATHTRIGAGDGVTAVNAVTDTDLSAAAGSTHRWFQLVSGAPTVGGTIPKTCAWAATFGTADGNFTWAEFGIDNGTASGNTVTAPLLNRALSAQGTKASGQTWTATATLSFT